MNYPDIDDAPLPFELYTDEELEQMQIEQEQDDWERSIPTAIRTQPQPQMTYITKSNSPKNTLPGLVHLAEQLEPFDSCNRFVYCWATGRVQILLGTVPHK